MSGHFPLREIVMSDLIPPDPPVGPGTPYPQAVSCVLGSTELAQLTRQQWRDYSFELDWELRMELWHLPSTAGSVWGVIDTGGRAGITQYYGNTSGDPVPASWQARENVTGARFTFDPPTLQSGGDLPFGFDHSTVDYDIECSAGMSLSGQVFVRHDPPGPLSYYLSFTCSWDAHIIRYSSPGVIIEEFDLFADSAEWLTPQADGGTAQFSSPSGLACVVDLKGKREHTWSTSAGDYRMEIWLERAQVETIVELAAPPAL